MFDPFELERILKEAMPGSQIEVRDMTGGSDHFEILVRSDQFRGKSMLEQHRLVYQALGDLMSGPVHAVQIKTVAL